MRKPILKHAFLGMVLALIPITAGGQDHLTVTTWNIETLGGDGRGFAGGFGRRDLEKRTDDQLKAIAKLIKDTLNSDIVAFQEASITHKDGDFSLSRPLDKIVAELGSSWAYYLPWVDQIPSGHANMFVGFLWNKSRVNLLNVYAMDIENPDLAGSPLFPRVPLIGYFEAIKDEEGANDFAIVNLHLKSGQANDENHLIAVTLLEYNLRNSLLAHEIKESDRIILGDFNDNPYARTSAGNLRFSKGLYTHLRFKGYTNLITPDFHSTRMDQALKSVIDHILVNKGARGHISQKKADIFLPGNSDTFADWRRTFSDHFPISFGLKIRPDDDADF